MADVENNAKRCNITYYIKQYEIIREIDMARAGIEFTDVKSAVERLLEQGQAPTINAVREEIGSGSYSTIQRHLTRLKESNGGNIVAMPPSLVREAEALYSTVVAQARSTFDDEREAFVAKEAQMAARIAELEAEADSLKSRLADSEGELAKTAEKASQDTNAFLQQIEDLEAALEQQTRESEQKSFALSKAEDRHNSLQARFDEHKAQAAHLESEFVKQRQTDKEQLERAASLLDSARSEAAGREQALLEQQARLLSEVSDYRKEVQSLQARIDTKSKEHATVSEELAVVTERLAGVNQARVQLKDDLMASAARVESLQEKLAERGDQCALLSRELAVCQRELEDCQKHDEEPSP